MTIWDKIDVLVEIASHIRLSEDLIAFSGVCNLWRCAAAEAKKNFRHGSTLLPWLMLPPKQDNPHLRSFFSLSKAMSRQILLPEAYGNKCYSSKGWLLVIDKDWCLFLLHPISRRRIELPHLKTFRDWEDLYWFNDMQLEFIKKAALSTSPLLDSDDYTLVVIHANTAKLAYFRPGFKTWITIDSCRLAYHDVIYFRDRFYVIDIFGITAVDITSDGAVVAHQVAKLPPELPTFKLYLVESAGKLLVVSRDGTQVFEKEVLVNYGTFGFQVFEVDLNSNKWTQINDLGDRALFVGDNSSISVQVSDVVVCKPNSIYFTDDCQESYIPEEGGKDTGVYDLQDGSIVPYFKGCNIYDRVTPPIWIEQNF